MTAPTDVTGRAAQYGAPPTPMAAAPLADIGALGWAVVGGGWVARDYVIPAITASANGRFVGVADRSEAALAALDADLGGLRTTDTAALLARDDVDAVYVATPNHAHVAVVEQAAAAGKAVLCEKPMATTVDGAARIVEACRAAGVPYATAFDQRFHPAHVRLRELIAAGALGTVTCVRIHYACWTGPDWAPDGVSLDNWRADPDRAGGGAFLDLAPHGLDLTQVLLGEPITDVAALFQHRVHDYAVDDGAVLVGRTRSGALLSHAVAYNCPETFPRRTLEVIGTEGRALALDTMGQTPGGTLMLTRLDGTDEAVPFDAEASPFRAQVEAFAAAVLGGVPFPFSPEHDLHTMRLLESVAVRR